MRTATAKTPVMGRKPLDNPKAATLNFRVHQILRDVVDGFARDEKRTTANMADLLLREAIIARMKARDEDTSAIEDLP